MYSCGLLIHGFATVGRPTRYLLYSKSVRTRDHNPQLHAGDDEWSVINGERGSGISAQAARHDDDDLFLILIIPFYYNETICLQSFGLSYSFPLLVIFKVIKLTHRWNHNMCYFFGSKWIYEGMKKYFPDLPNWNLTIRCSLVAL